MTTQPPDLSICGCGTRLPSEAAWSEHVKTCDRAGLPHVGEGGAAGEGEG